MTLNRSRRKNRLEHVPPMNRSGTQGREEADPETAGGQTLQFRIGPLGAAIAPVVFVTGVVLYFMVFHVIDLNAITASGMAGLLVAALFSRSYSGFWESVISGVSSRSSVTLLLILLSVGMVAAMIAQADVAGGFVWLAGMIGLNGGLTVAIVFVVVCVISTSTGSSFGAMFTAFPIFYPAGVMLGADPLLLAGAILSGALFGDNLAPISDTTVVSASTQRYRRRDGVAEIGGVVRSRVRYALVAAGISGVLFLVLGLQFSDSGAAANSESIPGDPMSLFMAVPVVVLLVVAVWKRDIFLAATIGVITGIATGLLTGVLSPADIMSVNEDGTAGGFLVGGVTNVIPLIGLCVVVFGMIGVLQGAGAFDAIVDIAGRSPLTRTPLGSELAIGLGAAATTALFAGANSPAMLMFGSVADRLGARAQLHPYRRANVMDCFTLGIGGIVPVGSIFLLVSSQLTQGYGADVPELSAVSIFTAAFYPLALTAVILVAVLTGWGRRFEGEHGVELRVAPPVAPEPDAAVQR